MKKNCCVMAVTKDELELPLAIADTCVELDQMLHLPKNTSQALLRYDGEKVSRRKVKYNFRICLVNFEEGAMAV